MGIVLVAFRAASAEGVPLVTMTSTLRRTSSAANAGKRSARASADRYSMMRLRPSSYPSSRRPLRKASKLAALACGGIVSSTPMRLASCCALAARGQATAAPPSAASNSRPRACSLDVQGGQHAGSCHPASGSKAERPSFPLYPRKRTSSDTTGMSAIGQKRTHALQHCCRYERRADDRRNARSPARIRSAIKRVTGSNGRSLASASNWVAAWIGS